MPEFTLYVEEPTNTPIPTDTPAPWPTPTLPPENTPQFGGLNIDETGMMIEFAESGVSQWNQINRNGAIDAVMLVVVIILVVILLRSVMARLQAGD